MRSVTFASFILLACICSSAQQSAANDHIFRITDKGVKPPQVISSPAPEVAQNTGKIKSSSVALVTGYVGIDGLFHGARILRSTGDSGLDAKALEGIQAWKFHPCTKDGKAVNCSMTLEVEFNLYKDSKKP